MDGYTGALRLNFYQSQYRLEFSDGALAAVNTYQPQGYFDGDAFFPGLTFLQLLFGFRSLADLKHAYPDCFTQDGLAALLLDTLFPRSPSEPIPLA
ncbi:MAG: hypothetical protein HY784_04665 [Chloroflexi bacterium]|nr:hypothetical protein [Chloroflexota bacterium]